MSAQLRLAQVHGYRGHQCRNNAFLTAEGEVIYFVASLGIVSDPERQQRFYYGHNDDVISMNLHEDDHTVATGQVGIDPFICVWDSQTMETLSILKGGHELGVSSVRFGLGSQSKFLVSCGLEKEHNIIVWDWTKGRAMAKTCGDAQRVFDAQLNPFAPNQLVSCGVDHIKFWRLAGNTLTTKTGTSDGENTSVETQLCLAFDMSNVSGDVATNKSGSPRVFSCTQNGKVLVWDSQSHALLQSVQCHKGPVFTIHSIEHGLATGGKDGMMRLWEKDMSLIVEVDLATTTKQKDSCVRSVYWAGDQVLVGTRDSQLYIVRGGDQGHPVCITQGHQPGELWGLCVSQSGNTFYTASDDGFVGYWEFGRSTCIKMAGLGKPLRCCAIQEKTKEVVVGAKDGHIFILNDHLKKKKMLSLRQASVDCIAFTRQDMLVCGCADGFLDVFDSNNDYVQVASARVCDSFITHINLLDDDDIVLVTLGDGSLIYASVSTAGILPTSANSNRQVSTFSTPMIPELQGVWGKYKDANDINVAAVRDSIAITGDDYGNVKVFNFPCDEPGAIHRTYKGHSAHVTNIGFDASMQWVVTTGGADHSVFVWQLFPEGNAEDDPQYDSEDIDSEYEDFDVNSIDSDIEGETQLDYHRKTPPPPVQQTSDAKTSRNPPPLHTARLARVHGYRGYDCRNNIFYDDSLNVLVYHVAAVGIVLDMGTKEQHFYIAHTDDILCLCHHPEDDLVATGQVGKDGVIHVWHLNTRETLSILKGFHTRGVCTLDFHPDGKKLVSVGLDNDHCICMWDWAKGVKLANTRGHKDKIFSIAFNPISPTDIVTVGVSHIKFWSRKGNGFQSNRGIFGKKGKVETQLCIAFSGDGNTLTGSSSGTICIWEKNTLVTTVKAHKGPVFAIHALDRAFLSGGKDGKLLLHSSDLSKVVKTYELTQSKAGGRLASDTPSVRGLIADAGKIFVGTKFGDILQIDQEGTIQILEQGHGEGELWGMATHPTEQMVVTSSDDKTVRVWDLTNDSCVSILHLPSASRSVSFDADGSHVAVGYLNGKVDIFDFPIVTSSTAIHSFHHRKENISDLKFSPDNKLLAATSHDNFVDIYSTETWKRVGVGKGASSYATHVDWDTSGQLLRLNSGAREELYFRAPKGKRQAIASGALESINWHTWTCVLGKETTGIWPPTSDVTDVNSCALSHDKKILVTGDDFGFVKLFDFPCSAQYAKHKKFLGHSAHVTNVQFTARDKHIVSVGGGDTALFVWDFGAGNMADVVVEADTDTDSEEEGYDSDVEREKMIDYTTKTYIGKASPAGRGTKLAQLSRKQKKFSRKADQTRHPQSIKRLQLEFVHGYRGYDARDNLRFIDKDTIVYHAAGACIVMNTRTRKQSFYLEHTDDVICLATNPKKAHYIATGQIGEDPAIHVWSAKTLETLSIVSHAHKIGVGSVNFSANGKVLVSVGVSDTPEVCVFRWQTGIQLAKATVNHRLFVVAFRPDSDVEFVTAGIKHIKFWTLTGSSLLSQRGHTSGPMKKKMTTMLGIGFGKESETHKTSSSSHITFSSAMNGEVWVWKGSMLVCCIEAHARPCFSMTTDITRGGSQLITGGKDGYVRVWDILDATGDEKDASSYLKLKSEMHLPGEELRSVCKGMNNRFLVGTESSSIYITSPSSSSPTLVTCGHGEGELWGLDCANPSSSNLEFDYVTVSDDKTLRFWTTSPHKLVNAPVALPAAARCVCMNNSNSTCCVGMENGGVAIVSVSSPSTPIIVKRDRGQPIRAVALSGTQAMLAVGSLEKSIDIYEFPSMQRLVYCHDLPAPVTNIAWSRDSTHIKIEMDSLDIVVVNASSGQIVEMAETMKWAAHGGVLSESVSGIWSTIPKKEHILCTSKSVKNGVLVSGDTQGHVKLLPYPCVDEKPHHNTYVGHAASVTNISFIHNDDFVVSTGGDDNCVLVWKTS
eukprot:m.57177 g.57177  ORF g.57177 m.57177 type:complete len:1939 (+) comp7823_c0_seq2:90-5906(+)